MTKGNQALNVNAGIGGSALEQITVRGSDWYFVSSSLTTHSLQDVSIDHIRRL